MKVDFQLQLWQVNSLEQKEAEVKISNFSWICRRVEVTRRMITSKSWQSEKHSHEQLIGDRSVWSWELLEHPRLLWWIAGEGGRAWKLKTKGIISPHVLGVYLKKPHQVLNMKIRERASCICPLRETAVRELYLIWGEGQKDQCSPLSLPVSCKGSRSVRWERRFRNALEGHANMMSS